MVITEADEDISIVSRKRFSAWKNLTCSINPMNTILKNPGRYKMNYII